LFPNLNLLRTSRTEKLQFKSVVIYKFDNDKISDIHYDKENGIFLTNYIDSKAIIKYKEIYFEVNRMSEYYEDLDNLEKYFETN
jgi:hypothetical protein